MIIVPSITPKGKTIDSVGIWMSGGVDSSLLCFMVAEFIKNNNLSVKIVPLTIDYKRPFVAIATDVRKQIEQLLDCKDIFLEHIVYNPPEGVTWTPSELAEQFHIRNYENFSTNKIQALYSGITTNPSLDVQQTFKWGVLEDVELKRGANVSKETVRYFEKDGGEFLEYKPFFEIDKKKIAELYKNKNLLDTLFPLTRSCEDTTTSVGHCGNCWWCEERMWAFGRLT